MTGPKIGMISYNPILKGRDNGWINGSLFIIQGDRGKMFGAPEVGFGESPNELTEIRYERVDLVQQTVTGHWKLLAEVLPQLDRVFIYVGSDGSEYAIRYAADHGLDSSEVVFVLCDCNEAEKRRMIALNNFSASRVIMCECGGRSTMSEIATRFLETGQLPE